MGAGEARALVESHCGGAGAAARVYAALAPRLPLTACVICALFADRRSPEEVGADNAGCSPMGRHSPACCGRGPWW